MGAFGTGSFENDQALDWLADFVENPSDDMLRRTFEPSFTAPGFLARMFGARPEPIEPYGEHVLAAAEVIATMRGYPPDGYIPQDFPKLPHRQPSPEITSLAIRGVDQILDPSAELHGLWMDPEEEDSGGSKPAPDGDYQKWLTGVRDIRRRLTIP